MRNLNATRKYPDALPSLLKTMNEETSTRFDTDPLFISELTDDRLMENPILYVNCDDQPNLEFPAEELAALRRYMEQGGFVYLDAGIKASFLGADLGHSYAAWEERPEVNELFRQVYPEKSFLPLPRNHEIFRSFYKGLPKNRDLMIEANQKIITRNRTDLRGAGKVAARDLFFRGNEGQGSIGLRCLSDLRDGVGQGRVRFLDSADFLSHSRIRRKL